LRKKWPNIFEEANIVLFMCAISEYNLVLYEDDKTNRLEESLDVFDETINNNFKTTPILLVFNKIDLFKEKMKKYPLKDYFEEYEGGEDFEKGIEFIEQQFMKRNKFDKKRIYIHKICALDDTCVKDLIQEATKIFV
jgi:GTPase SAR1 family protein